MRTPTFLSDALQEYLRERQMAMIGELRNALGSPCVRTVYRKLEALDYLSSYSHRGRYYTLPTLAAFNAEGLWGCRSVWFSRFGNLLATAQTVVERSTAGYTAAELDHTLHVQCQHTLTALVRSGRLTRERMLHAYVYFSGQRAEGRHQRLQRQSHRAALSLLVENSDLAVEEAKAAIVLFLGSLDERQRRLYAGLESLKTGHGGDEYIAQQRRRYEARQLPVISLDTKNRELIGQFYQDGLSWGRQSTPVFDHDFPSMAQGVGIPHGLYDTLRNEGYVSVGISKDTASSPSSHATGPACPWTAIRPCSTTSGLPPPKPASAFTHASSYSYAHA